MQTLLTDNIGLVIAAIGFVIFSEVQGVVCSFLNLTTHVVVRNFEMIMNCVFLAMGIIVLAVGTTTHSTLSMQIFLCSLVCSIFLILTGMMGVFAACQRHEGWFKAYSVVAGFNMASLIIGGFLMLVLGGAFSVSEYVI